MNKAVRFGIATNSLLAALGILVLLLLWSSLHAFWNFEATNFLTIAPDGRTLGRWSIRGAALFDLETRERLLFIKGARISSFSPDGRLAVFERAEGEMVIWNMDKRSSELTFTTSDHDPVFSPDGGRLATRDTNGGVTIWDLHTQQRLISFRAHEDSSDSLSFSPDGRTIATAGGDRTKRRTLVRIWDARDGGLAKELAYPKYAAVRGLFFAPAGRLLCAEDTYFDTSTGNVVGKAPVRPRAFSPDWSSFVGSKDDGWTHTVRSFDVATGAEQFQLPKERGYAWGAAYVDNGKVLITAHHHGEVFFREAATGRLIREIRDLPWRTIPMHWWLLGIGGLTWLLAWLAVIPPRQEEDRVRRSISWWVVLSVAAFVVCNGVFLHWVILTTLTIYELNPISTLMILLALQMLAMLVPLVLLVMGRITLPAAVVCLLSLGALVSVTGHYWVACVSAV